MTQMYCKHSTNDLYTTKGLPDSQFKQETNDCKLQMQLVLHILTGKEQGFVSLKVRAEGWQLISLTK